MSGSGPSAVTGQTGEMKRVVDWVASAWVEIQAERPDWLFMKSPFSVSLSVGAPSVIVSSTLASVQKDTVIATDGATRWPLSYLEPSDFAYIERRDGQKSGRIQYFTMDADGTLRTMPVTNEAVTVMGDYYRTPQQLAANTDVPLFPERYHMLIVYLSMTYAGAWEEASNIYQDGMTKFGRLMNDMTMEQLPKWVMPGPVA